jgi:hypothetical protein
VKAGSLSRRERTTAFVEMDGPDPKSLLPPRVSGEQELCVVFREGDSGLGNPRDEVGEDTQQMILEARNVKTAIAGGLVRLDCVRKLDHEGVRGRSVASETQYAV